MGDFEPINIDFKPIQFDFNINTNRWSVVGQQIPQTPIWDMPAVNLPEPKSIGKELGKKPVKKAKSKPKPKAEAKPKVPAKPQTQTPKVVEIESQTPSPEEQTTRAEKDKIIEEKTIKSFSALANASLLSDDKKIDLIKNTSDYVKMLGKEATFDSGYTDDAGNYHSVGTTKNGNRIELVTGKGPENSTVKTIKITTEDGTSLTLLEISGDNTYIMGIVSNSTDEDNNINTYGMSFRKDLDNNCISKVAVYDGYRDTDGILHANTTTQTYNTDGSTGYAFFEETASDGCGNSEGQSYVGNIDENGDFNSVTQNPLNSWEATSSSYTSYDTNGNETAHTDLSQPQEVQESVMYDVPPQTTGRTPSNNRTGRHNRQSISSSIPKRVEPEEVQETVPYDFESGEIPQIPVEGLYIPEEGQTNIFENVTGTLKKQ